MLLSVDWDYFVGTAEWVFDSPFWGTPDQPYHRLQRWRELAQKRDPVATGFEPLQADFPLLADPKVLLAYRGVPTVFACSHEAAWGWLEGKTPARLLNLDSHHDLYSQSGDPQRVRAGNWAGLALAQGRLQHYTCLYPPWHAEVRVTEGYDLGRTQAETVAAGLGSHMPKIDLQRSLLPANLPVEALLVVQSPAWTNPLFDGMLLEILAELAARELEPLLQRSWR